MSSCRNAPLKSANLSRGRVFVITSACQLEVRLFIALPSMAAMGGSRQCRQTTPVLHNEPPSTLTLIASAQLCVTNFKLV